MGHTPTASPAKIIKIAKAEVGYHEGRSNGHWNNHQKFSPAVPGLEWSQNQAWCATFVSWCALKAGFAELFPRTASTDLGARWFKDHKRWSEYPAIGAQIFFGTNGDMYHTGLVYDYDGTYVYTVEGNTNASGSAEGDGVYLKKRLRRSSTVQGYGYPAYAEGIVSADPAWAKKAPNTVAAPAPAPKPAPAPAPGHALRPMTAPKRVSERFWHYKPYYIGDSFDGLRRGRKKGHRVADLDFHITLDGGWACLHWGDFRDFRLNGKKVRGMKVRSTKMRVIRKMKTRDGHVIRTAAEMLRYAKRLGYRKIEVEPKGVPTVWQFVRLQRLADSIGIEIVVKRLSNIPGAVRCLANAKAAGCRTRVLPRGTRRLKKADYWPVTDEVRGLVHWV